MAGEIITSAEGPVGVVRINRPESLNALNQPTLQRLATALQRFDEDPQIRCLVLAGHERAFANGIDAGDIADNSLADVFQRHPLAALDDLDRLRKPLVAAVLGYAVGVGFELVLASDVVIAAETARFGLNEVGLGLLPGGGGTQRLTRRAGRAVTLDLLLTGRLLSAQQAATLGLVSRVVPSENCEEEALAVAQEVSRRSPLAVEAAKRAVRAAEETALSAGLAAERQLSTLLFGTHDQKEGLRAFLEQRPPLFTGR